jgi:glycosyltransferase involved in cell wall biosynthesis
VIGRNEGPRLEVCLQSIVESTNHIVYVDSGSTDNSLAIAEEFGVQVLKIADTAFTAAKARNTGFYGLMQLNPQLEFVQFVDGDCQVAQGWIKRAANYLDKHEIIAVVCGRRRERYPEASIFNLLCDIEWDTPIGQTLACGGDAMMRVKLFDEVNGFQSDLIAGEEPELCFRLRENGWKIWRLDAEMTLHDAAITSVKQWWKRSVRTGFAFSNGAHLHGKSPERYWVKESRSALIWAGLLPVLILIFGLNINSWFFAAFLLYPLQVGRLAIKGSRSTSENWKYALFMVVGKFPELLGNLKFHLNNLIGSNSKIIEYK